MPQHNTVRKLAAILSADVVGYSRLMGRNEETTLAEINAIRSEIVEPALRQRNGHIVKTMGDGLLLEFPSVVAGASCAIEIQTELQSHNEGIADDLALRFRIGIHLGDVIVEGDDIFGDGVNVAALI